MTFVTHRRIISSTLYTVQKRLKNSCALIPRSSAIKTTSSTYVVIYTWISVREKKSVYNKEFQIQRWFVVSEYEYTVWDEPSTMIFDLKVLSLQPDSGWEWLRLEIGYLRDSSQRVLLFHVAFFNFKS